MALPLLMAVGLSQSPTSLPQVLEGHVRFLSSDLLLGRDTPSSGLDISAEYIESQYRAAGLEPLPDKKYFIESIYKNRRGVEGKVRNVIGLIPGSDPKLKDQWLLVTAHYDHLGVKTGEGDLIFNGANDNASGVAGIIEIGRALAASKPKRTIAFVAFWGEEKGLVGAQEFVKAPPVPLKQIVGMVNLEQIGRTDDSEGPRVESANVTGFDFSTLTQHLVAGGKAAGIEVVKHATNSDRYFFASDNAAFAQVGIPAHTVSVAYSFPDYHQVGDHWEKLDYRNMAKVVAMLTNGVKSLSNDAAVPVWDRTNPRTKRYSEAYDKLHEKE